MNQQASLADAQRSLQAQQASAQTGLQAQAQSFNQQEALNAAAAARQAQAFNQSNTAHAGAIQDQTYMANRDLNQLNALRTGSQVSNPTFGSYAQQQTTQGPDMLSAANMGYNAQVAQTNANNAGVSGMFGGLTSMASAAAPFMNFSDERLKKDIRRVGELPNGIGVYVFTYIDEDTPRLGCIAQDVQKFIPDAVKEMGNGFLAVNYAEVLK